jgi:hypothetical protein
MKAVKVQVTLTLLEAEAVAQVISRSLWIANRSLLMDGTDKRALWRASDKFDKLVLAAQRPPTVKEPHEDPI